MTLRQYYLIFRKYILFIIILPVVMGALGYITSSRRAIVFGSRTTVNVGANVFQDPRPNNSEVDAVRNLTNTYSYLINTYTVRQSTVEFLQLTISQQSLTSLVNTETVTETSLLILEITHRDPVLTATVANTLVQQYILSSIDILNLTETQQVRYEDSLRAIEILREELIALDATAQQYLDRYTGAEGVARKEALEALRNDADYRELVGQINDNQAQINQIVNQISRLQQAQQNSLQIVETALVPLVPNSRPILQTTAVASAIGLIMAIGLVIILDYFRSTIETPRDVTHAVDARLLGVISKLNRPGKTRPYPGYKHKLSVHTVEQYQSLRAGVVILTMEIPEKSLVFTSASRYAGKTTTIANLGVVMAESDRSVLLVDADLRNPALHTHFDQDNTEGLTTILLDNEIYGDSPGKIRQYIQPTGVGNLDIIPSGRLLEDPNSLLGSKRTAEVLGLLPQLEEYDLIFFDTPPCLPFSDSIALTTALASHVVLVVRAGKTTYDNASRAREKFQHIHGDMISVILNG